MTGPGKCESLLELRGPRITKIMRKEKSFHLQNALPLVAMDFHTQSYLVAGDDVDKCVPNR